MLPLDLTIADLIDVLDMLEDTHVSNAKWDTLGLRLGFLEPKLREIDDEERSRPDRCMRHLLSQWLQQNYDVGRKGEPSWDSLADALERINGQAAGEIRR